MLCEKSGAIHLAEPGLTAGWLADEIQVNFEIYKICCGLNIRLLTKIQPSTNASRLVFQLKPVVRLFLKVQKNSGSHIFS